MLKDIQQRFYAMRNGIVADALRKGGMPHKVIFGLQVPQLAEIARELGPNAVLAQALWDDCDVRESRLLACYLFPLEEISVEKAVELASQTRTPEESNMLAFRIFRRLNNAYQILQAMKMEETIPHHAIEALTNHLS